MEGLRGLKRLGGLYGLGGLGVVGGTSYIISYAKLSYSQLTLEHPI